MKVAFTGGGTLGHIYPAISIIDYLKERDEDKTIEYLWIGRSNKREKEIIESIDIKYYSISCGKLRRYMSLKNFIDFFRIFIGYFQAKKILKKETPDLLFSKGGFVSVPVVYAAKNLNIKIITHESDITLGLATKLNSKVANIILKGFYLNDSEKKDKRYYYCGNPIRKDLLFFKDLDIEQYERDIIKSNNFKFRENVLPIVQKMDKTFDKKKKMILVLGGSLGALEINKLIDKNLDDLLSNYNIYHQMGELSYRELKRENYICTKYINKELGYLLKKADLVISRCGANALNEEIAFKKNILAIPLKTNSSRGEQVLNSKFYKNLNLLEVLENSDYFIDTIRELFDNKVIENRNKAFKEYNIINSNELIYERIVDLIN